MISEDPDIELQSCSREKQRFSLKNNKSSGYRDVQLCVKLKTRENIENGRACENHLCELQLHLKAVYDLKSDEGHEHYVQARNLLGN